MNTGSWVGPLLLLPGVGLLVMSTAARYNMLHSEMHRFDVGHSKHHAEVVAVLVKRARLFRDALVCLYIAAALLSLAPLVGAAVSWITQSNHGKWGTVVPTSLAIAFLVAACVQLVRESLRSIHIIDEHANDHGHKTVVDERA